MLLEPEKRSRWKPCGVEDKRYSLEERNRGIKNMLVTPWVSKRIMNTTNADSWLKTCTDSNALNSQLSYKPHPIIGKEGSITRVGKEEKKMMNRDGRNRNEKKMGGGPLIHYRNCSISNIQEGCALRTSMRSDRWNWLCWDRGCWAVNFSIPIDGFWFSTQSFQCILANLIKPFIFWQHPDKKKTKSHLQKSQVF